MLSLFRTNQLLVGVLIIAYAALLHIVFLWQPSVPLADLPGIASEWLKPFSQEWASWQLPATIILLSIQALLLNAIVFNHRIISPVNLFPGVFLVLVSSILPAFLSLSVYHFANVFLLLAIRSYLKAFRVQSAADLIFNTGFWLGVAILFVPSYLFFMLAFSIMLPILKSGKFRDQVILLVGTVFPLYLLIMYYYWQDQLAFFWAEQWQGAFGLPEFMDWKNIPYFGLLILTALTLVVLFSMRLYRQKTKMEVQLKLNIMGWLFLASGISALFTMPWNLQHWLAAAPFIGFFLSMNFTKARAATAEAWHLLLLLLLFLLHFGPMLGIPFV